MSIVRSHEYPWSGVLLALFLPLAACNEGGLPLGDRPATTLAAPDAVSTPDPCPDGPCVTTIAGSGRSGAADAPVAEDALLGAWIDVAVDAEGAVYGADLENHGLRVYNSTGHQIGAVPAGAVGLLAGGRFGCREDPAPGSSDPRDPFNPKEEFGEIVAIAREPGTGDWFLADRLNRVLWRMKADGGGVAIVAGDCDLAGSEDGAGRQARLTAPGELAFGRDGLLYFIDGCAVRRADPRAGRVETIAGATGECLERDGDGIRARFHDPRGLAFDSRGNLFTGDSTGAALRRLLPPSRYGGAWTVSTIGGLRFPFTTGMVFGTRDRLFTTRGNVLEIRIDEAPVRITEHSLSGVAGIGVDPRDSATLWFGGARAGSGPLSNVLSMAGLAGGGFDPLPGIAGAANRSGVVNGPASRATFDFSAGDRGGVVAADAAGNVWVTDPAAHRVRFIDVGHKDVSSIGSGVPGRAGGRPEEAQFDAPATLAVDRNGNVWVVDGEGAIYFINGQTHDVAVLGESRLLGEPARPIPGSGLIVDDSGSLFFMSGDSSPTGAAILVKVPVKRPISGPPSYFDLARRVAGTRESLGCDDGPSGAGRFSGFARGLAMDASGAFYIADARCGLRRVRPDGTTESPPIIDENNQELRWIDGLAFGPSRDGTQTLYATRRDDSALYAVDLRLGRATRIAGVTPAFEDHFADGPAGQARFWEPGAIAVDRAGNVIVADWKNDRVRKVWHPEK